jgi:hypothetical protein
MHTLEYFLLETAATWEKEGIAHGQLRAHPANCSPHQ